MITGKAYGHRMLSRNSTTISVVLHILLIIAVIGFKSTHILVPSRSDGIEVSLISSDEISPDSRKSTETKPILEPIKTIDTDADIKLKQENRHKQKAETNKIIQPKAETKPTQTHTVQQKPQKHKIKVKPNAQINDLLNDITATKSTGKGKHHAAQGGHGSSDSNNRMNNYADLVIEKVRPFVIIPENLNNNVNAVVEVTLLPNMEVHTVKLKKSSGNAEYDDNVQQAINRVKVFPPLPHGEKFTDYRKLILHFRP
jgi:colicin import membrane protein